MHRRECLDVELQARDLIRKTPHRRQLSGPWRFVCVEQIGLERDVLRRQVRHQHAFNMRQRLHVVDPQNPLVVRDDVVLLHGLGVIAGVTVRGS